MLFYKMTLWIWCSYCDEGYNKFCERFLVVFHVKQCCLNEDNRELYLCLFSLYFSQELLLFSKRGCFIFCWGKLNFKSLYKIVYDFKCSYFVYIYYEILRYLMCNNLLWIFFTMLEIMSVTTIEGLGEINLISKSL